MMSRQSRKGEAVLPNQKSIQLICHPNHPNRRESHEAVLGPILCPTKRSPSPEWVAPRNPYLSTNSETQ